MIKGMDVKGFEQFQSMTKQNMDAALESAAAWTKGLQTIAAEVADYSKKSFEDTTEAVEKAFNAKSVEGAFEVQAEFAKSSYESFVGRASKINELYVTAAKAAYSPIEKRTAKAA
jgi:hypothetical protein